MLVIVPLVEGRSQGWPVWSLMCLAATIPTAGILVRWEVRLFHRDGEPGLRPDLLRRRSFAGCRMLAFVDFASVTSLFTISILWQEGLGRSALAAGLVVVPFACGSLLTASTGDRVSCRLGRYIAVVGTVLFGSGEAARLAPAWCLASFIPRRRRRW